MNGLMAATELMALRRKAAEQATRLADLERFQSWEGIELPLQGLYRFPLPSAPLTHTQLQELVPALRRQLSEATNCTNVLHTDLGSEALLCEAQRREIAVLERAVRSQASKSGFAGTVPDYLEGRIERRGRQACTQLKTAVDSTTEREKGLKAAISRLDSSGLASPESGQYLSSNREDIQKSLRMREDLAEEMSDLRRYLGQTKVRSDDIIAVERANAALFAEYGKLQDFRFQLDRQNRILTEEIAGKNQFQLKFAQIRSDNIKLKSEISAFSGQIENLSEENTDLECRNSGISDKLTQLRIKCQKLSDERTDLEALMEEIGESMRSVQQESLQTRTIEEKLAQKVWEKEKEIDKLDLQNRSLAAEYEDLAQKTDSTKEKLEKLLNEQKNAISDQFLGSENVKSELEALFRSEFSLKSDLQASVLSLESLKSELFALQAVSSSLPSALHSQAQLQVCIQDCAKQIVLSKAEVAELRETKTLLLLKIAGSGQT